MIANNSVLYFLISFSSFPSNTPAISCSLNLQAARTGCLYLWQQLGQSPAQFILAEICYTPQDILCYRGGTFWLRGDIHFTHSTFNGFVKGKVDDDDEMRTPLQSEVAALFISFHFRDLGLKWKINWVDVSTKSKVFGLSLNSHCTTLVLEIYCQIDVLR